MGLKQRYTRWRKAARLSGTRRNKESSDVAADAASPESSVELDVVGGAVELELGAKAADFFAFVFIASIHTDSPHTLLTVALPRGDRSSPVHREPGIHESRESSWWT